MPMAAVARSSRSTTRRSANGCSTPSNPTRLRSRLSGHAKARPKGGLAPCNRLCANSKLIPCEILEAREKTRPPPGEGGVL
ncbi:hypothetical protein U1Q18_003846 [Sarracenia purpurea var. burkii]